MSGRIYLHKEHGVNPHLTYCPRCGGETNELILSGNAKLKDGTVPPPSMKLPASQPCDACKEELKAMKAELDKGGLRFRCSDCKAEGIIKHTHPLAIEMAEKHPGHGIEFTKEECPQCRSKNPLA